MGGTGSSEGVREPSEEPLELGKFRILSIDGGGIRGVIPAVFLRRLEELLAEELGVAAPEVAAKWEKLGGPPCIADCFHLIAGTSTGGLLAAALTVTDVKGGRPKLTAAASVGIFNKHGREIFKRPFWRNVLDHWNLFMPKYPLKQLKKVLEQADRFGEGLLEHAPTGVLITSYNVLEPGPRMFTPWGRDRAPEAPAETMVHVALATAAAPTYFRPQKVAPRKPGSTGPDPHGLIDGGMFACNPALAAICLALRRTEEPAPPGKGLQPEDLLLISLGTGHWAEPLNFGRGGVPGWLYPRRGGSALFEALQGGQGDFSSQAAHMLLNGWSTPSTPKEPWNANVRPMEVGGGPRYWRYQALLPGPWSMDDVGKLEELNKLAEKMTTTYDAELKRLAKALIQAGPVTASGGPATASGGPATAAGGPATASRSGDQPDGAVSHLDGERLQ